MRLCQFPPTASQSSQKSQRGACAGLSSCPAPAPVPSLPLPFIPTPTPLFSPPGMWSSHHPAGMQLHERGWGAEAAGRVQGPWGQCWELPAAVPGVPVGAQAGTVPVGTLASGSRSQGRCRERAEGRAGSISRLFVLLLHLSPDWRYTYTKPDGFPTRLP